MEKKFERIKDKKEFFTELSIAVGKPYDSLKNGWFYPLRVPSDYIELVDKILDKRIDYQEAVKKLHIKYFGK